MLPKEWQSLGAAFQESGGLKLMKHLAMIESEGILNLPDPRWWEVMCAHPSANIFHHPAWSTLMAACYGYHPFVVAVQKADGSIGAGLPFLHVDSQLTGRRWVALPFTDHCQPLYQNRIWLEMLAQRLLTLSSMRGIPRLELRCDFPLLEGRDDTPKYVLHELSLEKDAGNVFSQLHSMHKRNVHLAEKNGLQVVFGNLPEHLDKFYDLHLLCRRRQGLPIQPRRFFSLLEQHLLKPGLGFVLLAMKEGYCLAGAVFLHWGLTLTYKYGASCSKGQTLRANNLILWTAIQWGCENGYTRFDLGRSDISNAGLREFKSRWGAAETPLYYTRLGQQAFQPGNGRLGAALHNVIRSAPPWMCKFTGELLYRHFG
jgi:hypothetical protein